MKALQWTLWFVGLGLQSMLIMALARGAWKHFPALLAYIVCLLGTTTAEILAYVMLGKSSAIFATYYWSAELIRQSALFALVVSLTTSVLPVGPKGQAYGRLFTFAAITTWAGSILVHHSANLDSWMTSVVRNLSFFTGILTLFVWFAYARRKDRDMTRLMIAAGLGLQMTGEALGQAIRLMNISRRLSLVGALLVVLSHLFCLFVWWKALQSFEPSAPKDESWETAEES